MVETSEELTKPRQSEIQSFLRSKTRDFTRLLLIGALASVPPNEVSSQEIQTREPVPAQKIQSLKEGLPASQALKDMGIILPGQKQPHELSTENSIILEEELKSAPGKLSTSETDDDFKWLEPGPEKEPSFKSPYEAISPVQISDSEVRYLANLYRSDKKHLIRAKRVSENKVALSIISELNSSYNLLSASSSNPDLLVSAGKDYYPRHNILKIATSRNSGRNWQETSIDAKYSSASKIIITPDDKYALIPLFDSLNNNHPEIVILNLDNLQTKKVEFKDVEPRFQISNLLTIDANPDGSYESLISFTNTSGLFQARIDEDSASLNSWYNILPGTRSHLSSIKEQNGNYRIYYGVRGRFPSLPGVNSIINQLLWEKGNLYYYGKIYLSLTLQKQRLKNLPPEAYKYNIHTGVIYPDNKNKKGYMATYINLFDKDGFNIAQITSLENFALDDPENLQAHKLIPVDGGGIHTGAPINSINRIGDRLLIASSNSDWPQRQNTGGIYEMNLSEPGSKFTRSTDKPFIAVLPNVQRR